jgi:hypothetical protein
LHRRRQRLLLSTLLAHATPALVHLRLGHLGLAFETLLFGPGGLVVEGVGRGGSVGGVVVVEGSAFGKSFTRGNAVALGGEIRDTE